MLEIYQEQKITIALDEYNNHKNKIPGERSLKQYLRSSGSLCEKDSHSPEKKLNDALVNAECMHSN